MYENLSMHNGTAVQQYQGVWERLLFSVMTSAPCCVFLYINGTMLFTLRSKAVFQETSRYVLLFNLLFGDTVQMGLSQLLYIMAVCRIKLTYPVCGVLTMIGRLTSEISPLTLVVMSLERYVAVCHPLKHAMVVTISSTRVAVIVVWAFSSLNVLIHIVLLLDFPFAELDSLQMKDFCSYISLFLGPITDIYEKTYTCCLFVSAGLAVASSYIGVLVAARSASTDKTSAQKARNTLLLHLVQLGLTLCSTLYNPILVALSRTATRLVVVRIQNVLYVCIFIFPRCLSALIYGIRDKTIRPALLHNVCCGVTWLAVPVQADK